MYIHDWCPLPFSVYKYIVRIVLECVCAVETLYSYPCPELTERLSVQTLGLWCVFVCVYVRACVKLNENPEIHLKIWFDNNNASPFSRNVSHTWQMQINTVVQVDWKKVIPAIESIHSVGRSVDCLFFIRCEPYLIKHKIVLANWKFSSVEFDLTLWGWSWSWMLVW